MSPAVKDLLLQYRAPDGSERPVVPEAIVQSAVPVEENAGKNRYLGPADAVVERELESEGDSESDPDNDLSAVVLERPANQESAGALWSNALTNGQKLLGSIRAKDIDVGDAGLPGLTSAIQDPCNPEAQKAAAEEVQALVDSVSTLRKFHHSDVQKELEDFEVRDSSTTPRIVVGFSHAAKPLNTFDPEYWAWWFHGVGALRRLHGVGALR